MCGVRMQNTKTKTTVRSAFVTENDNIYRYYTLKHTYVLVFTNEVPPAASQHLRLHQQQAR